MEQMALPFPLDTSAFGVFLTQYAALENEIDRLGEEKRLLKDAYKAKLPMRALLVSLKRVRAMRTLEQHPKEPMPREHLQALDVLVDTHLTALKQETETTVTLEAAGVTATLDARTTEALAQALWRPVPDMTG